MMKRIFMLMALASMVVAAMALSGVAQARPIADSPDAKCAKLAIKTLGPSFNPANYTFIGGTAGNDTFTADQAPAGNYVVCGFGGNDSIYKVWSGNIFLGGSGDDYVFYNHSTFYGGDGSDGVDVNTGTFYGGAGDDYVTFYNYGTFYGEEGNDYVSANSNSGTFSGGPGDDTVGYNAGTFVQD